MTDAVEVVRQGVEQKPADELVGAEGHDLRLAVVPIVFPTEGDLVVGQVDEPGVRDGNAMRVATEISQHLLGSAEGQLGIDDPFDAAKLAEPTSEGGGLCKIGEIAEEAEFAGLECGAQFVEEQSAEEAAEHADRQEESGPAGNPAAPRGVPLSRSIPA